MAHLAPVPFGVLARRMFRELERREAIFDLPARRFVTGAAHHDVAVRFHGRVAAAPFGPAAGPHTQLAQNMVLSWLAGGRILELKTVQADDTLVIPRPCIDMRTVGYNVEWSQELRLAQSLEEYVKGALLIHLLATSGRLPLAPGFARTVFDVSVGYDLAGITSEPVQRFLRGMTDAAEVVARLRRELPAALAARCDGFPPCVSGSVTLSTFHGCPPDEIERIVAVLLRQGLDCVVKLNPTLLGRVDVAALLHDALGYTEIRVPPDAFDRDLPWARAEDVCGRLAELAAALGRSFGVKLTNTLVVENRQAYFPSGERTAYLSGAPLHVLAMHLVRRFRRAFGARIPLSFSAGIDRHNFPDAVALGLVPVTVCTDLLRPGGYGRGAGYVAELARRMDAVGATSIAEFIVRSDEAAGGSGGDVDAAALRNTERYVERVAADPRYHAAAHRREPRKLGTELALFDCLTCEKCIAACPNDANFAYDVAPAGAGPPALPRQYANFADLCNECGNCDVFCPEAGGPHLRKPRLFVNRDRWLADAPRDAILVEPGATTGRFDGVTVTLPAGAPPRDGASPHEAVLRRLRDALLAPGAVNYVSAWLDTT